MNFSISFKIQKDAYHKQGMFVILVYDNKNKLLGKVKGDSLEETYHNAVNIFKENIDYNSAFY